MHSDHWDGRCIQVLAQCSFLSLLFIYFHWVLVPWHLVPTSKQLSLAGSTPASATNLLCSSGPKIPSVTGGSWDARSLQGSFQL